MIGSSTIHLVTVDVDLGYQVWSAWRDKKEAEAEAERLYLLDLAWNQHTQRKNYGVESLVIGVQDDWKKAAVR